MLLNCKKNKAICCVNCFQDAGFVYNAEFFGKPTDGVCPKCGAAGKTKLTKEQLIKAANLFFVRGSKQNADFGSAYVLQMNDKNSGGKFKQPLANDVSTLRDLTNQRVFYFGPPTWMVGATNPMEKLQHPETRPSIISKIVNNYPEQKLAVGESFYRIRRNPNKPEVSDEYDAPPLAVHKKNEKEGRLCRPGKPVLYGSQDLELCIHEARGSIEDSLYVATLTCTRELKMIDLTATLLEDVDIFEAIDIAVLFTFRAGKNAYEITKSIADAVELAGYDGIIYPSYFSGARSGYEAIETGYEVVTRTTEKPREYKSSNLALFGRPMEIGDVKLACINTVSLTCISYGAILGPTGL